MHHPYRGPHSPSQGRVPLVVQESVDREIFRVHSLWFITIIGPGPRIKLIFLQNGLQHEMKGQSRSVSIFQKKKDKTLEKKSTVFLFHLLSLNKCNKEFLLCECISILLIFIL